MRIHKYRAWDKYSKTMHKVTNLDYTVKDMLCHISVDLCAEEPAERFVLMQYTGLKDKNNKKIFESDLLEDENGCIWKVYWAEGIGAFRLSNICENDFMDCSEVEYMKIIGNIYETPELLEEKHGEIK